MTLRHKIKPKLFFCICELLLSEVLTEAQICQAERQHRITGGQHLPYHGFCQNNNEWDKIQKIYPTVVLFRFKEHEQQQQTHHEQPGNSPRKDNFLNRIMRTVPRGTVLVYQPI